MFEWKWPSWRGFQVGNLTGITKKIGKQACQCQSSLSSVILIDIDLNMSSDRNKKQANFKEGYNDIFIIIITA